MLRTQIQLTEPQAKQLKALAAQEAVSVAELIRRSIDQFLVQHSAAPSPEELRQRALTIVGKYASGSSDGSREHDRYLDEAFGAFGQ